MSVAGDLRAPKAYLEMLVCDWCVPVALVSRLGIPKIAVLNECIGIVVSAFSEL